MSVSFRTHSIAVGRFLVAASFACAASGSQAQQVVAPKTGHQSVEVRPSTLIPPYSGAKEYSLTVMSTRREKRGGQDQWAAQQPNKTRVIEQLAGFKQQTLALDKWGGRLDKTETATGYFYTKKRGERWWIIDPDGHAYLHKAVVSLGPSNSEAAGKTLIAKFGDKAKWMADTHALLYADGFNGAGAWSRPNLIRESSLQAKHPIAYTPLLDFMANYARQGKGLKGNFDYTGFPHDTVFVFDPGFPEFVDKAAQALRANADDPYLLGYFSDNELPFKRSNLDGYLQLPHDDPGYLAASRWLSEHHATLPNDELRIQFTEYETDRYASIVSAAIRKYDPHHMYIGFRITARTEQCPEVFRALGKYADAISVNYYEVWTPEENMLSMWAAESGKPLIISEFYVKGNDTGMSNTTGAGWLVGTQAERGLFYQDYVLQLIQSKNVVGWHWFMYQDNDPNNPKADESNRDSNKGIVNIRYEPYLPLLDRMRQINTNAYALTDYFDTRK